jgi:hypothetical protein
MIKYSVYLTANPKYDKLKFEELMPEGQPGR